MDLGVQLQKVNEYSAFISCKIRSFLGLTNGYKFMQTSLENNITWLKYVLLP